MPDAAVSSGLATRDIRKRRHANAAETDLYVAGFPCQPWSAAGIGNCFEDKQGDVVKLHQAEATEMFPS
eukprot:682265-Prorocentrum_lima.AAC.1